ncbi:MAG: histidine--tRNA ligase, partial [Rhodospirillales bacterium]|nr:histidine--tRNA ligase [Rhodospirillales bacterium]
LELNTLGNTESRAAYRNVLVEYFQDHRAALSKDSLERLERNPLRILDSKNPNDREVVAGAPEFGDSLDAESSDFFAVVESGLATLGIGYVRNSRLVRGLDYYCHTAFEFTTEALGAQGAVLAGGRYDGLVGLMGGPQTAGVGWAAGVERLAMLIKDVPSPIRPIAVIPVGEDAQIHALRITNDLRQQGFTVELGYRGNLKKRLNRANKLNARIAIIIGADELAQDAVTLRDFDTGEQELVKLVELKDQLARYA